MTQDRRFINRADRPLSESFTKALLEDSGLVKKASTTTAPAKISLNDAKSYGIVHMASEVYQTRDQQRDDFGTIWYLTKSADGKSVLVKDMSSEGEVIRHLAMVRTAEPPMGGAGSGFGQGNSPLVAPYGGAVPSQDDKKLEWMTNNEQVGRDPAEMSQQPPQSGMGEDWKDGFADGFSAAFQKLLEESMGGGAQQPPDANQQQMTPLDENDVEPSVHGEPKQWNQVTRTDTQF